MSEQRYNFIRIAESLEDQRWWVAPLNEPNDWIERHGLTEIAMDDIDGDKLANIAREFHFWHSPDCFESQA